MQTNIDGVNYELKEMTATNRSIIALKLKHIVAGAKDGVEGGKEVMDSKLDYVKMVMGMVERIEPEAGAHLLKDIIVNGLKFPVMDNPESYDNHFTDHYDHQVDLVAGIMELNFGKTVDKIKKKLTATGLLTLISSQVEEESPAT